MLYLSAAGGGLDTNVRVLGPALVQAGHRVSILYIHFPGEVVQGGAVRVDGCDVLHASIGNWHYYFNRVTFGATRLPMLIRALEYARTLGQAVSQIATYTSLDLIEIPEVYIPSRLFNSTPFVTRLHSSAWMCRRIYNEFSPWTDRVEARWEAETLRRAQGISAPSAFVADYIHDSCRVNHPIDIIPYAVDTTRFAPGKERQQPPIILFVGRIERRKGADILLRAIPAVRKKFPNSEFVFVGSTSLELKESVAQFANASHVKFLGVRPQHELIAWYQRASLLVAPSLWDNSPNTIYEAMACGTPVVASRVGGIPELVDHGVTGGLVVPRDECALADAIVALLGDPARREQMGQCAREKAIANWSVGKILTRTLMLYERVLH